MSNLRKIKVSPIQMIALGFVGILFIGALLLSFPAASKDGVALSFLDAFFTSTSATCVTGLVVYDTYAQFSLYREVR